MNLCIVPILTKAISIVILVYLRFLECCHVCELNFAMSKIILFDLISSELEPAKSTCKSQRMSLLPQQVGENDTANASCHMSGHIFTALIHTLKTTMSPEKGGHFKRKIVFQPSFFRGELLVLRGSN